MAYDPQRNRVRAQPAADEPAPVDLVLGGPAAAAVLPEPAAVPDHVHGPDCDHDHEHGPDLRLIVAAGLATLVAAVLVRRRRRSARG